MAVRHAELLHRPEELLHMSARGQAGISLIEVLVSLGIIALLLGLGLPSFRTYLQNTQTRAAAESILNGLQTTRNESIRRNRTYEFTIHDATAWDICPPDTDVYPCPSNVLMKREASESSANALSNVLPAGADTVAFNGLGRVIPNANGSASLTTINVYNPQVTGAQARPMRILVLPGGAMRLCDPAVASGDPRACS
jgi:type IV fimbrial biogenesis protein FimT